MDPNPSTHAGTAIDHKSLNIVVVGGSLAGLMHGIMLKRAGHNVRMLEQTTTSVREGQAAGIGMAAEAQAFMRRFDLIRAPYMLEAAAIKVVGRDSQVKRIIPQTFYLTSWDVLYYRLRANFDGYKSEVCPEVPGLVAGEGEAKYELGRLVINVVYVDGQITVKYEDIIDGGTASITPDLVIAADGGGSLLRKILFPEVARTSAGIVAWRAVIPEAEVSSDTKRLFAGYVGMADMGGHYLVMYTIPGPDGSLELGRRLFNFIWYRNCPEDSSEFADIMTDSSGHRHHFTVPVGKIRPEIWERQKAYAAKVLPASFAELVSHVSQPFITSISDAACPRAALFDNKMILVGDALAISRPNTGMSTNRAAISVFQLEKALKGDIDWPAWEHEILNDAYLTNLRAMALANDFLEKDSKQYEEHL